MSDQLTGHAPSGRVLGSSATCQGGTLRSESMSRGSEPSSSAGSAESNRSQRSDASVARLERAWSPFSDLEIRSGGDGRTVHGIAVPFDSPTPIQERGRSYTEVFRMGAFAKTINDGPERVKFLVNHDRYERLPLGRALSLREDPAGLIGEFRVSKTRDGDEVLELISDGVLDAFSVGFRPIRHRQNDAGDFVERLEVALQEVSTVAFPAYAGATIAGLRADEQHPNIDAAPDAALSGTSDGHLEIARAVVDPTFAARRRLRLSLRSEQA